MRDGSIEYIGRADFQLKLRGRRVEPGEIEAAIKCQVGVQDCVVLPEKDAIGSNVSLIGYIVPTNEQVDVSGLRQSLKTILPEYMIPSAFVQIAGRFPLTPNGKVDRGALSQNSRSAIQTSRPASSPRRALNALGQQILKIWQETLSVPDVGADDNFFDSGGNSLLLAEVYRRVLAFARSPFPMIELFRYPTIASLCDFLESLPVPEGHRTS